MSKMLIDVNEKLVRTVVPAMDEILGYRFPLLDAGHIRVIDYMGGDESIVQAARISYGKGTKSITEDEGLIRYLLRHTHTTPFEMCELKIHIRCPMDLWRQWIRHRTANVNEYSTRYSEAIDDKAKTIDWRSQSKSNKQGSGDNITSFPKDFNAETVKAFSEHGAAEYLSSREHIHHLEAEKLYQERLSFGVAKEQARKDLPLSTYTEAYWKCDLHNIMHFLSLRMDKHAQLEIRQYANVLGEIVSLWCPIAWKAFNDYNFRREAVLLTARDKAVVKALNEWHQGGIDNAVYELCETFGWFEKKPDGSFKSNREREECEAKLLNLGFEVPWSKS